MDRTTSAPAQNPPSSGAELVTVDGRSLPLVGARLAGEASGGIARCVLEQRFENRYDETLRVRYRMPLPADGAVSAYEFELAGRVIAGRVHRKAEARERFEQAIAAGQTAALLEQERADIFTQELGNILPGETILARITIDQRLVWLAGASRLGDRPFEGEWELRFPTVIGPRYVGAHDTEEDARATHVQVAPGQIGARISIELEIRDALAPGKGPTSPSHELRASAGRAALRARQGATLDRDIVVRWPVATPEVGLSLEAARDEAGDAYGLLTIVPPAPSARAKVVARDLTILLDTSGSMSGPPLEAAKAVVSLLIESLGEGDRLELIEFSNLPRRYQADPVAATEPAKRAAIAWVRSRVAGGGTEMADGVREALRSLRPGAQRQVVVVTDGYVGGEQQIVGLLHGRLPGSCRLHVLGVGSAVNRSLAAALARAGRGVEVIAGLAPEPGRPHDDLERAAGRLIAHTRAPVLVDLELSGSALIAQAPERVPDVFAGAPVVAALALRPEGGELVVRGALAREGWERRIRVPARRRGEGNPAIAKLYARERVADLEARSTVGESPASVEDASSRMTGRSESFDGEIEEIGLKLQIATRLTSWVAIDEQRRATGPSRTEDMPQELPYGTSARSFGLRGGGMQILGESPGPQSVDFGALEQLAVLGRAAPGPAQPVGDPNRTLVSGDVAMEDVVATASVPPAPAQPAFKTRMMGYGGPAGAPPPSAEMPSFGGSARSSTPRPSSSVAFSTTEKRAVEASVLVLPKRRASLLLRLLPLFLLALLAALIWWLVR